MLGTELGPALLALTSLEQQVTAATPPTVLLHTQGDKTVPVQNSILYYQALARAGMPAELYLFEQAGTAIGMRDGLGTASAWPRRVEDWLDERSDDPRKIWPGQVANDMGAVHPVSSWHAYEKASRVRHGAGSQSGDVPRGARSFQARTLARRGRGDRAAATEARMVTLIGN